MRERCLVAPPASRSCAVVIECFGGKRIETYRRGGNGNWTAGPGLNNCNNDDAACCAVGCCAEQDVLNESCRGSFGQVTASDCAAKALAFAPAGNSLDEQTNAALDAGAAWRKRRPRPSRFGVLQPPPEYPLRLRALQPLSCARKPLLRRRIFSWGSRLFEPGRSTPHKNLRET